MVVTDPKLRDAIATILSDAQFALGTDEGILLKFTKYWTHLAAC
jgi:hypothetical protein